MEISQRSVLTSDGIKYEIAHCYRMLNKFPKDSKEYVFALKIFVELARKLSIKAYEGDIIKI